MPETTQETVSNPAVMELRKKLEELGLNTTGTKAVLKERIKKATKRKEVERDKYVLVDSPQF